ncbi:MAG: hypothetical protein AB9900_02545 [Humidesulfovibrio sp.]
MFRKNALHSMSRVAFADVLDRLEILLQETRHAQENIIYSLREPMFSRSLRLEELMLWHSDISKHILEAFMGTRPSIWFPKGEAIRIARNCTTGFPTPKKALGCIQIAQDSMLGPMQLELDKHWAAVRKRIYERVDSSPGKGDPHVVAKEAERCSGLGLRLALREIYGWHCRTGDKNFSTWYKERGREYLENLPKVLAPADQPSSDQGLLLTALQTADLLSLELAQLVAKTWTRGDWSDEQKRYYYNLVALQHIKRDIVRDRLILLSEGWASLGVDASASSDTAVCRFMLLRSAIIARIERYIERLGDCQEMFNKSQDTGMGLSEFPHPSGERRREQRLYDAHLGNRCLSTWNEFRNFARYIGIEANIPFEHIQHRWTHGFTSTYLPYQSDTAVRGQHRPRGKDEIPGKPYTVHFVNSSYFMPDRPDIQPLISHEVAHAFHRELFNGVSSTSLQRPGEFFDLLRALTRTVMDTQDSQGNLLLSYPTPETLVDEIAADLMTGAVRGTAYLWALFLELLGKDLDEAFRVGSSTTPDPALLDHIRGYRFSAVIRGPWYLRLKVLCGWLRDINSTITFRDESLKPLTEIEQEIINGVEGLIDNLQAYIDEIGSRFDDPTMPSHKPEAGLWGDFGRRLQRAVSASTIVDRAAEWRGAFYEQLLFDPDTAAEAVMTGKLRDKLGGHHLPAQHQPLNRAARELLAEHFKADLDVEPWLFSTTIDVAWHVAFHSVEAQAVAAPLDAEELSRKYTTAFAGMRALHAYALEWDISTADKISSTLEGLSGAVCSTLRSFGFCRRTEERGDMSQKLDEAEIALEEVMPEGALDVSAYPEEFELIEEVHRAKEAAARARKCEEEAWQANTPTSMTNANSLSELVSKAEAARDSVPPLMEKTRSLLGKVGTVTGGSAAFKVNAPKAFKTVMAICQAAAAQYAVSAALFASAIETTGKSPEDCCPKMRAAAEAARAAAVTARDAVTTGLPYELGGLVDWLGCSLCPDVGPWLNLGVPSACGGGKALIEAVGRVSGNTDVMVSLRTNREFRKVAKDLPALALRASYFYAVDNDAPAGGPGVCSSDPQTDSHRLMTLEHLQYSKILLLAGLLQRSFDCANRSDGSNAKASLNSLLAYARVVVKNCRPHSRKGRYRGLALAMRTGAERLGLDTDSPQIKLTPMALGRLSFAGLHRMLRPEIRDFRTQKKAQEMPQYNQAPDCRQAKLEDNGVLTQDPHWQTSVMGHFDRLLVAVPVASTRHAPRFRKWEANGPISALTDLLVEPFLPYHIRWEWALPLHLHQEGARDPEGKNVPPGPTPLAYISIILTKPAERLTFIQRLRSVLQKDWSAERGKNYRSEVSDKDFLQSHPRHLEDLGPWISPDDLFWLCDGWQDVLLEVRGGIDRMRGVFAIKSALHADPQVQSAEIVFATSALDVLKYPTMGVCFDMRAAFRTSRWERNPNHDSLLTGQDRYKWGGRCFSIVALGRRLDYALYLEPDCNKRHEQCKAIMDEAEQAVGVLGDWNLHRALMHKVVTAGIDIDRFQTDIYRVIKDY